MENSSQPQKIKKEFYKRWVFWAISIFIIIIIISFKGVFEETKQPNKQSANPYNSTIYKTEESDLKTVIDNTGKYDVEMLDIRFALQRVINKPIYDLPFYAMKDEKGNGYIAVIITDSNKALFLVSPKALNQTEKSDLEKSIKAINGTAKTFNMNLEFAGAPNYDPYDILIKLENKQYGTK